MMNRTDTIVLIYTNNNCSHVNTLSTQFNFDNSLGGFSRRIDDIFSYFSQKMKIGFFDISCRRQFAWSVKACFLGKIKHISNCRLQKYWPSMLSLKQTTNLVDFPPVLTRRTVFMVSMPVWFPAYQAPFERGVYSKRKQFNPQFSRFRVDPFFRREANNFDSCIPCNCIQSPWMSSDDKMNDLLHIFP